MHLVSAIATPITPLFTECTFVGHPRFWLPSMDLTLYGPLALVPTCTDCPSSGGRY
jgi:hypothetical protein